MAKPAKVEWVCVPQAISKLPNMQLIYGNIIILVVDTGVSIVDAYQAGMICCETFAVIALISSTLFLPDLELQLFDYHEVLANL